MGSRGPMPKRAELVRGHRKKVVRPEIEAHAPVSPAPGDWTPEIIQAWETYWASELAAHTLDVDLPGIRRLFSMYEQHARAAEVVNRALVVKGSTGQLRTNPLADHLMKLEGVILRLENEYGLTPMARTRLGIQMKRPTAVAEPEQARPVIDPRFARLRAV